VRQLDELLDEILQVRDEPTDEADHHEEESGNGAATSGNGAVAVAPSTEAPEAPAEEEEASADDWEGPAEAWAEPTETVEVQDHPAQDDAAKEYAEHAAVQPSVDAYTPPETYTQPEAYTPPETYNQPETNTQPETYAPESQVDAGPPVEEALADSWNGTFDAAGGGWEGEGAPKQEQWTRTPAPPAPAYRTDWTEVEAAAAAPVIPETYAAPEAPPATPPEIAPEPFSDLWTADTSTEADPGFSSWVEVSVSSNAPTRGPAAAPVEVTAPVVVPAPARFRRRGSRRERPAHRRALRAVGVAGLVLAVAAASLWTITVLRGGPASRPAPPAAGGPNQQVVVWTVWDEKPRGPAFVSVLASGGGLDPVLLAIPPKTVVSVPGRGYESVGDTAAVGRPEAVAGAVENILGVQVDASTGMPLASLAPLVDRIGGIEAEEVDEVIGKQQLNGEQTVEYLRARSAGTGEAGDDTRFIRWLEVSTAIVTKAYEKPDVLQEIPSAHRPVFVAAGSGRTEVLDLPVEAIGAGLARPDGEYIAQIVRDYFLTTNKTERVVRIVVMNGNGRPGTGQTVARLLVPSGFRLVSSLNAPKFNVRTTRIVAGSEELLDEAYLAQRLLGVGEVYVVDQESHVADLSIVVGKDFLRR
jgi:hypothetical protein